MDLLIFSAENTGRVIDGDRAIYPASLLFTPGDYPDKKFSMTNEDLFKIVENFKGPLPGNIEHTGFLKGKACQIDSVFAKNTDKGLKLCGSVSLPLALDNILEDHERRLSCEFDRPTGNLSGLALTTDPYIEEAVLMSKFKKTDTTSHGQYALQDIHDRAARAGAICNFDTAKMTAKPEMKALQAIHDSATANGATCKTESDKPSWYYNKDGEKEMDEKTITTSVVEGIKAFFSGSGISPKTEPVVDPNADRIAKLEKQLSDEKEARFKEFATQQTDMRLKEGKITPAERENTISALFQARRDDDVNEQKITFSDGTSKNRTDMILASLDGRPAIKFGRELINQELEGAQALFNSPDKDELKELYNKEAEEAKKMNTNGNSK